MRLEAQNLACIRGGREVLSGLGFAVDGGQALLITGPNGAGKSSLLRMVAGLVRIAVGRLLLSGGNPEASIAEQAHYLGHQDALKPALTVGENLGFWSRFLAGGAGTQTGVQTGVQEALGTVGLAGVADLPAAYLSAGQRRRLSMARLIAVPRPIWLLDEPTSALDRQAQAMLADLMRQHLAGAGLILAATHGPIGLDGTTELRLGAGA